MYDQLNTLLVEIEGIINSRPLTYLADDQDGVSSSLSPSHLINGRRITTISNNEHFEIVSTHQSLIRRLKHHRHLLSQFTNHWRKDYLLSLRENHSLKVKKSGQAVITRDVVVLKSDTSKRLFWKLAIVDKLLMNVDGRVRAAAIKVSESQGGTKLLRRSVKQHLFPIEVRVEDLTDDLSSEQTQEQPCNLASAQQPNDNSTQMTELDVTTPDKRPRDEQL